MKTALKVAILCALAVAVFSVIYLSLRTYFELEGYEFVGDGDCVLRLNYSTNRPAVARLTTAENLLVSETELSPGESRADLKVAENRETPGSALVLTIEQGGRTILTGSFPPPSLQISLTSVVEWGWDPAAGQSTIQAVAIRIANSGGLPAYVHRITGLLDGRLVGGSSTEWSPAGEGPVDMWIMPGAEENPTVRWSGPTISPGYHGFKVTAEGIGGEELASMAFPSIINVPSEYLHGTNEAENWEGSVNAPAGWHRPESWRM
ncbi:MAG: hypothetical protein QW567_03150 [Candidatus Hadarchaeales archaeon]